MKIITMVMMVYDKMNYCINSMIMVLTNGDKSDFNNIESFLIAPSNKKYIYNIYVLRQHYT